MRGSWKISAVAAAMLLVLAGCASDRGTARGVDATWNSGAKQGVGTSTTLESKLWYTLGNGVLDEVYYPQADTPDVRGMQFLVTDGSTFTDTEADATTHEIALDDARSLSYRQVNTARSGRYRITKTYVTDPDRPSLLMQVRFQVLAGGPLRLYLHYDPSLNNSGMGDMGDGEAGMLRSNDGRVASALGSSTGFVRSNSGYAGTDTDGSRDLIARHGLINNHAQAGGAGNLVQTAQLPVGADTTFTVALGFGDSREHAGYAVRDSLKAGWEAVAGAYRQGWHDYLDSLPAAPPSVADPALRSRYDTAVMLLKAHEDKTFRGAFVASTSIPWGEAVNANDCCTPGYHAVWSRDLYEVATAELAVGDRSAAERALDHLLDVQRRPDGSYPQNARLDGSRVFDGLQLDEVAYPLILARQLDRVDAVSYAKLKPSAEYLTKHGPRTPQERWEEAGGFSPSTIAAEIAGLVCAASLAEANHDSGAAEYYLKVADEWRTKVNEQTFTTSGPHAPHGYYLRIDDNGNPNDGGRLNIANGGGNWDEREIVDAGFLELVRLGISDPRDSHITDSVPIVDAIIRTDTPHGQVWHRYNHDGYGESATGAPWVGQGPIFRGQPGGNAGRAWPLLTGERGEYELALGDTAAAQSRLVTMAGTANAGGLIPEQVWDQPDAHGFRLGEGTGSATPLAWSLAQYVRLAVSISAGRNVETPPVVAGRYVY